MVYSHDVVEKSKFLYLLLFLNLVLSGVAGKTEILGTDGIINGSAFTKPPAGFGKSPENVIKM